MTLPAGYQKVLDMFAVETWKPTRTWYVDPSLTTGDGSGRDPDNAMRTAAHINAGKFAPGDALLQRADTTLILAQKIRNMKMVGVDKNPFYWGAYHFNESGDVVRGRGNHKRPRVYGCDPDDYNPYSGMTNQQLMAMIPTPDKNPDGTFKRGSGEGQANWYQATNYVLMLWIADIEFGYSGGRHLRFTQSAGIKATGLLCDDCLFVGSMQQAVHLAGIYDAVFRRPHITWTGVERHYWNPEDAGQAALATKGTQGDPDTPCNVWFDQPLVWDGWSTEAVNSNSGNTAVGVLDGFAIDQGKYGYYDDRTSNMGVLRCIAAKSDREAFKEFTGGEHGRGACAFIVENEVHSSSFDWDGTYNTPEDFKKYRSHDSVLSNNIAIGMAWGFCLRSQASTKDGAIHEGLPHSAAVYHYGCMSINPKNEHWNFKSSANNPAYVLDTERPPRIWGCVHIGDAPVADRNDAQFADVFRGNYFDHTPPDIYSNEAVIGGLELPIAQYDDLSVLMEFDENEHMSEEQALAFRDRVRELCKPLGVYESGILKSEATFPDEYSMTVQDFTDFEGNQWGGFMPIGAFTIGADSNGGDSELEARVAKLESEVADLAVVVTDQGQAIQSLTESVALLATNSADHALSIDNIESHMSAAGEALLGISES